MQQKIIFECLKCGAQSSKWSGRCLECGGWGTMGESSPSTSLRASGSPKGLPPAELTDFNSVQGHDAARIPTGIGEMDRVLGGGIVPGSLILLSGEPGIGKSTLLLQLASQINNCDSKNSNARECLEDKSATRKIRMHANASKTESEDSNDFEEFECNSQYSYREDDKIVEKELSYKLTGIFFDVQKELGRFCREKQYGDALEKKFTEEKINFKRESPIEIADRKSNFADFIIENKILLELKTKNFIDKEDYYQTQRYIYNANLHLGIIINFQQEHLKPKRIVNPKFRPQFEAFECNSSHSHREVLYNSGEESAEQIKMRFDRLGLKTNGIKYLGATDVDVIAATIAGKMPALAIIDSIQTVATQEVDSSQGSVSQIKAATAKLVETAKKTRVPVILVGHITKDGDIAGPKTLEHMVDTVLYFEGEKLSHYRILRAVKNRFGNTNEIGIFEMTSGGLAEIPNPSAAFLEQKSDVSGSVLTCVLNGNRPLLVEIQALTNPTAFGYPLRKSSGFDLNRLNIIATIINQRTGIKCANCDIILNVAGGIKIQDPAADLAVALAIISSIKNKILPRNLAAIGELGLGGEIRQVNQLGKRLEETKRLGLSQIISPQSHKTLQSAINTLIN